MSKGKIIVSLLISGILFSCANGPQGKTLAISDNLDKFGWLLGQWTDGSFNYTFDLLKIHIQDISKGEELDDADCLVANGLVTPAWRNGNKTGFMINSKAQTISINKGPQLTKTSTARVFTNYNGFFTDGESNFFVWDDNIVLLKEGKIIAKGVMTIGEGSMALSVWENDFNGPCIVGSTGNTVLRSYETFEDLQPGMTKETPKVEDTSSQTIAEKSTPERKEKAAASTKAKTTGKNPITKALSDNQYITFDSGYSLSSSRIYLIVRPFVFSEDKMRGKAYFISYEEDHNYDVYRYSLQNWSDYEIVGDYLRLYNVVIANDRSGKFVPTRDMLFKVSTDSNGIVLTGRYLGIKDTGDMHQADGPFSDRLMKAIDKEYRMYDL